MGKHQLLSYAYDIDLLGDNIDTMKGRTETVIYSGKDVCLERNVK
jgi:hypothetical protein